MRAEKSSALLAARAAGLMRARCFSSAKGCPAVTMRRRTCIRASPLPLSSRRQSHGGRSAVGCWTIGVQAASKPKTTLLARLHLRPKTTRPKTQDPRPKTQDPRPKTQDPRPKTQDPRPKTQDPRPKTQDDKTQGEEFDLTTSHSLFQGLLGPLANRFATNLIGMSERLGIVGAGELCAESRRFHLPPIS